MNEPSSTPDTVAYVTWVGSTETQIMWMYGWTGAPMESWQRTLAAIRDLPAAPVGSPPMGWDRPACRCERPMVNADGVCLRCGRREG